MIVQRHDVYAAMQCYGTSLAHQHVVDAILELARRTCGRTRSRFGQSPELPVAAVAYEPKMHDAVVGANGVGLEGTTSSLPGQCVESLLVRWKIST